MISWSRRWDDDGRRIAHVKWKLETSTGSITPPLRLSQIRLRLYSRLPGVPHLTDSR